MVTWFRRVTKDADNVAKFAARGDAARRHLFVVVSGRGSSDTSSWALPPI